MTLNAVLDVGFGVGFATATQRKLATEVAAAVHPGGDGGLRLSAADLGHPRGLHLDRANADTAHGSRRPGPNLG